MIQKKNSEDLDTASRLSAQLFQYFSAPAGDSSDWHMEAGPAAPAAAAGPAAESAFLQCLSQLDDVLTDHLVPKLIEQGSAGAVRLTCSQLRSLLQPNIQHLDLTKQLQDADNPFHSLKVAKQLTAAFPNCTQLDFAWSSSLANMYRSISQVLAGLPHLHTVSIKLDGGDTAGELDPMLCQLHMHATGLCSLSLQLNTDYTDNPAWASLGKMVTLTSLLLSFGDEVTDPFSQQELGMLTGLSKLQALRIHAPGAGDWPLQDSEGLQLAIREFPGCLTALTKLELSLEAYLDFSSVSGCVALQDLQVRAVTEDAPQHWPENWSPQEWAALAQLTQLTRLRIDVDTEEEEHDGLLGVILELKGLCAVGAFLWKTDRYLPVFHGLTQLTEISGGWTEADELDVSSLVCSQVKELRNAWGHEDLPFAAFPHLAGISFDNASAGDVLLLSRCCPALQRLEMPHDHGLGGGSTTTSAYSSLATLKHLTHLELSPCRRADFVVFVSAAAAAAAAAAAGAPQLQYLHVHGPVSVVDLMLLPQLVSACCVRELSVVLHVAREEASASGVDAICMLLAGLAVVPKVTLLVRTKEERDIIDAAKLRATEHGLPLPASLRVSGSDQWCLLSRPLDLL